VESLLPRKRKGKCPLQNQLIRSLLIIYQERLQRIGGEKDRVLGSHVTGITSYEKGVAEDGTTISGERYAYEKDFYRRKAKWLTGQEDDSKESGGAIPLLPFKEGRPEPTSTAKFHLPRRGKRSCTAGRLGHRLSIGSKTQNGYPVEGENPSFQKSGN